MFSTSSEGQLVWISSAVWKGRPAADYFSVFQHLILAQKEHFIFKSRSRRPPRDYVNALLSFLYAILLADIRGRM